MTFTHRLARTQILLGSVAVVIGCWTFYLSRNVAFTAARAPRLGSAAFAIQTLSLNRLGALVVIGLGAVGIIAGALRRIALGWVSAAGFAMIAVQVLVQWRAKGQNVFGSVGATLSFAFLLCAGFAVSAAVAHTAKQADVTTDVASAADVDVSTNQTESDPGQ